MNRENSDRVLWMNLQTQNLLKGSRVDQEVSNWVTDKR